MIQKLIKVPRTGGFPGGSDEKESACDARDPDQIPGQEDHLEKETAMHSSIFAWRIPWTEELEGYRQSDMTEQLMLSLTFSKEL